MKVNEGYYVCQPGLVRNAACFREFQPVFRSLLNLSKTEIPLIQSLSSDGLRQQRELVR